MEERDFQASLENFIERCQNMVNEDWDEKGYSKNLEAMPYPIIAYMPPKRNTRYVRITKSSFSHQMSVYCFVDSKNGDVLKAKSWKGPEPRYTRGNIYSEQNGMEGVNPYGANLITR